MYFSNVSDIYDYLKKAVENRSERKLMHCETFQAVSTGYYLVTSSTEIVRSVTFKVLSELVFLVGSTFTEV